MTTLKPMRLPVPATQENLLLRLAVEYFLCEEAALLDNWLLDEWIALFTEDARYVVPTTDRPDGDPRRDLVFIDDNLVRLQGRVNRLKSRFAHREYPASRTRRFISNVRLTKVTADELGVEASFAVYRARSEVVAPYVGLYRYTLARLENGELRIRSRRAELILERLSDHGAVSIIL
ncbi:MAG: aromatic-ring-hydroxylating dioxygenase subunit beta [Pseudomonadota bacterium]